MIENIHVPYICTYIHARTQEPTSTQNEASVSEAKIDDDDEVHEEEEELIAHTYIHTYIHAHRSQQVHKPKKLLFLRPKSMMMTWTRCMRKRGG